MTCCLNLRVRLDVNPRKETESGSPWFGHLWLPLFLTMLFLGLKNMGNGILPESQKGDFGTRSLKLGDRPDQSAIIGSQYNVPRFVV